MKNDSLTIGVDLGGTRLRAALVATDGAILQQAEAETDVGGGPRAVIAQLHDLLQRLQRESGGDAAAVGVGVAGQVRSGDGVVRFAPNLRWRDVPLQAELQAKCGGKVLLLNDVRAATWGEWLYGAGRGCEDLVLLFVGTGIGGGLVCAGRVLDGAANTAGEIGHMTVALHGPPCSCGNHGCLEALAGGWAIARRACRAAAEDPAAAAALLTLAGDPGAITAAHVAAAAQAGDRLAGNLLADAVEALVAGAATLVNAVNPARLIVGGGVAAGMGDLPARLAEGLRDRALEAAREDLQVIPARLGGDAGVIGAAAVARSRFARKGARK